jgi:hypothetical protein
MTESEIGTMIDAPVRIVHVFGVPVSQSSTEGCAPTCQGIREIDLTVAAVANNRGRIIPSPTAWSGGRCVPYNHNPHINLTNST